MCFRTSNMKLIREQHKEMRPCILFFLSFTINLCVFSFPTMWLMQPGSSIKKCAPGQSMFPYINAYYVPNNIIRDQKKLYPTGVFLRRHSCVFVCFITIYLQCDWIEGLGSSKKCPPITNVYFLYSKFSMWPTHIGMNQTRMTCGHWYFLSSCIDGILVFTMCVICMYLDD